MQWFLRFRICIIICIAVLLITAAVLFSAVRAVLPYTTGYKNEIQQEISNQIGLPVEIDSIDTEIYWFTPRLKLLDVIVYDKHHISPLFSFKEAFVSLDVIGSILRREIIVDDIGLVRADISIEKLSPTEWLVQGIKISSKGSAAEGSSEVPDQLIYMIMNSSYLLHESNIYYQDHTGDKLNLKLLDVNVDVRNSFNNHDIKLSMNLPAAYGESLAIAASLHGDIDTLDGDIYVEAKQVNVRQWNKKFKWLESFLIDTVVDVELWSRLDKSSIQSLTARFATGNILVKNTKTNKAWMTDYLSSNLQYVNNGKNWKLSIADFYFGEKAQPQWGHAVDMLLGSDGNSYYFSADMLRYTDVKNIAEALLSEEQLSNLNVLADYKIQTDIYNIYLQLSKDFSAENFLKGVYLEASVHDLSMVDLKNDIKLKGFDALVLIEQEKVQLDLVTKDASIDLSNVFREPVYAAMLSGKLQLQQQVSDWLIYADKLQLDNKHIKTFSRLELRITPEKNIFIDAQTDFYQAHGKYVHHYLPTKVMSPELVNWLDAAVTDGDIAQGIALIHGNLKDFPYDKHDGVFQVLFTPENVSMHFLEDWPLLENVSANVKFNNRSLTLTNASGKTMQVSLFNGFLEIPDLTNAVLTVSTSARGLNEGVQAYVWKSPLDDILGDALRLFEFKGKSELSLSLNIPLEEDGDVDVDGQLTFINTDLYYSLLGYEVKDINGVIEFTQENIFADTVKATVENRPVYINAFTRVDDSGSEVVFHLDGLLEMDYLLQRHDWIPENWISGQSYWSVDIEIPNERKDYLVHVEASSYLEDVVFDVSDKVKKSKNNSLIFNTEIDFLQSNNLRVKAILKDKGAAQEWLNLSALRNENNIWNFDIESEYVTGAGEFSEGLEKETSINLNMQNVDLYALFANHNNKSSKHLLPSDFPALNWTTKILKWDDWIFSDAVLETSWNKHGMLINKILLKGNDMIFNAHGTWLTSWRGAQETVLQGEMSSNNIGATLSALGFQRSVDRAKYTATFNAKWPAEPYAMSWKNMKGSTSFEMKNGEILDIDPGAGGRLLGLFNIFRLTNRLASGFNDVYRKGYSFDSITADFEFVNGDGSLNNFKLSAAAADITMFGRIGMVEHDYSLLLRVKPHTDTLTFAGGALIGGVAVGAGLALVQKIFDLSVIGHEVYSITGTWDNPVIEKIVERKQDANDDDF